MDLRNRWPILASGVETCYLSPYHVLIPGAKEGGVNGTRITFPSGPLTLEGVLTSPAEAKSRVRPAVVIAHPHPLYGGDMNNGVVMALARKLAGIGLPALRFNFRGVGGSEGSHDDGPGELEDLEAAVSFLATADGVDPENIALAGYSFGAEIVIRLASQSPRPMPFVAVSPVASSVTAGRWQSIPGPKLVICGDSDPFLPAERLMAAVPRAERRIVAGEDHFWLTKLAAMADLAEEFFMRHLSLGPFTPLPD